MVENVIFRAFWGPTFSSFGRPFRYIEWLCAREDEQRIRAVCDALLQSSKGLYLAKHRKQLTPLTPTLSGIHSPHGIWTKVLPLIAGGREVLKTLVIPILSQRPSLQRLAREYHDSAEALGAA